MVYLFPFLVRTRQNARPRRGQPLYSQRPHPLIPLIINWTCVPRPNWNQCLLAHLHDITRGLNCLRGLMIHVSPQWVGQGAEKHLCHEVTSRNWQSNPNQVRWDIVPMDVLYHNSGKCCIISRYKFHLNYWIIYSIFPFSPPLCQTLQLLHLLSLQDHTHLIPHPLDLVLLHSPLLPHPLTEHRTQAWRARRSQWVPHPSKNQSPLGISLFCGLGGMIGMCLINNMFLVPLQTTSHTHYNVGHTPCCVNVSRIIRCQSSQ